MQREKSYFEFQNPDNSRLLPYKARKGAQKITSKCTPTSKNMPLSFTSAEKEKINVLHATPCTL